MREYTKIEGSYMKIGEFIQTIYDSFDPESMFNINYTNDQVTTQLEKDCSRTQLISIDKDYKAFESKCFDFNHQKGSYAQGSFTGAVFSIIVFMPIIKNYVENNKKHAIHIHEYGYGRLIYVYIYIYIDICVICIHIYI